MSQGARIALTALAVLALQLSVGVTDHDVWSPTEPTVAGIVWNLLESGDLAVPRINGLAYLEKPPLYYWAAGLSARLAGGPTAGALRLPAALFGLVGLAALFAIVRRRQGSDVACLTVLVGASFAPYWEISHRAGTDVAAICCCIAAFACYARSLPDREGRTPTTWPLDLGLAVALAAGFYAKNFYPHLVVMPVVLGHLLWQGAWRRALLLAVVTGLATAVALVPWVVALDAAGGTEYLRIVFIDNTLGRFVNLAGWADYDTGPLNNALTAEKGDPPWFYLGRLLVVPLPWILLAAVAVVALLRRRRAWDPHERFVALGLVGIPLVLTIPSSKVTEYLQPVSFFFWLAIAEWLGPALRAAAPLARWERLGVLWNALLVVALIAVGGVALGIVAGRPLLGVLGVVLAAASVGLARSHRPPQAGPRLTAAAAVLALAAVPVVALGVGAADARKSHAAFFAGARDAVRSRAVITPYFGDHRLPHINWGIGRAVTIVGLDEAEARLRGALPVAAFLPPDVWDAAPERWQSIPGVCVAPRRGPGDMLLLTNPPTEGQSCVPSSM